MSLLLRKNDSIAIVANSNGIDYKNQEKINYLIHLLNELGINTVLSPVFYKKNGPFNGTGKERADVLNTYFKDNTIKAIFDVSGGDLSNETLDYIDFEAIRNNPKPFLGYSDLSTLLNGIYHLTNSQTYYYQLRNLVGTFKEDQIKYFQDSFMSNNLPNFNYEFLRGSAMSGTVIGGNIRCLLKLIGTRYQPNFKDKILFLEGLSGDCTKISTFLNQYKQIGAFKNLKGIILGTFTEMERENYTPSVEQLLLNLIDSSIPIIKSKELGHGEDCKCIIIGEYYSFKK